MGVGRVLLREPSEEGDSNLTYEEMATLAAKVETCLNSRPICPLCREASSLVAVTPGYFLTGTSLLSLPEPLQDGITPEAPLSPDGR